MRTTLVALALATIAAPVTAHACPTIVDLGLSNQQCASTDRGLVIAETSDRANILSALAEAAANNFNVLFGKDPARYVIVERTEGGLIDAEQRALKETGHFGSGRR